MTNRCADEALRRLAARQYGLLTRAQAHQSGLGRAAIARRLRSPDWEALTPRVFRLAGAPESNRGQLLAAILDLGPTAVADGQSAAALFGLPGFDLSELEVAVPRADRRRQSRLAVVHTRVTMRPDHRLFVHGIPTAVVPLTLLDIAGRHSPARTERAVDHALARRLVSVERLRRILDEPGGRGRAGTAVLREIVEARRDVRHPPTGLERRVVRLLEEAGLPRPDLQVDVGDDAWIGRVDFRWPGPPPVVLEVDSDLFHTSLLDREADAARDERLRSSGHIVGRVTDFQAWHRPWEVVEVAATLLNLSRKRAA